MAGARDRTAGSMYAWMYLSNASNLMASLAVYHWVSVHFGTEGFAQYAVARRAVNLLAPAMMLGLGIALPRAIALANTRGARRGAGAFRAAFISVSTAILILVAVARFWPADLAGVLFGDRSAGLARDAVGGVSGFVDLAWRPVVLLSGSLSISGCVSAGRLQSGDGSGGRVLDCRTIHAVALALDRYRKQHGFARVVAGLQPQPRRDAGPLASPRHISAVGGAPARSW